MSESPATPPVPMLEGHEAHYVRTQEYSSLTSSLTESPSGTMICSAMALLARNGPQTENGNIVIDSKIFTPAGHEFAEGEFVCPGFFSLARLDGFIRRYMYDQWTYELRRQAQAILPFLFLGPSSCSKDYEFLRRQGITLLLSIRNRHSARAGLISGEKAAAEAGVQADAVDILDYQELISAFPRIIRRINDHLAGVDVEVPVNPGAAQANDSPFKRKVLVFCESGNERSAGVVVAYIMVMLNMNAIQATKMVQEYRFCVNIGDPIMRILSSFDSILSAKRDVERSRRAHTQNGVAALAPPPVPPMLLSSKRSFAVRQYDNDSDVDMAGGDMEIDGDDDLQSLRKSFAPFQDAEG